MDKPYLEQPNLHARAPHRAALLTYPGNLTAALEEAQADSTKTLFGVAHGIPSVYLTKILASTKPDFIWIDAEHGMWNRREFYDAIHAIQHHSEGRTMAIARAHKGDEATLTTALDAGASGIVIPHCESAAEVKEMIEKTKFPSKGTRSFSPWIFTSGVSDASLYGNDPFNITTGNSHIAVIPQIETVKGLENMEEIAAVPGIGALTFGPNDYSIDAGISRGMDEQPHPELLAAMSRFAAIGSKYGKPLLGGSSNVEMVPTLIEQGFRVIVVLFDNWGLASQLHGNLSKARGFAAASAGAKRKEINPTSDGR